jgi:hypothetical protein
MRKRFGNQLSCNAEILRQTLILADQSLLSQLTEPRNFLATA